MRGLTNVAKVIGLLIAIGGTPAMAQEPQQQPQGQPDRSAMAGAVETATATVVKVDAATREVTLRAADGQEVTVKAGDEIKNLDKLKAGDKVDITYLQSIALALHGMGEKMSASEQTRTEGELHTRGGTVVQKTTATAEIVSVDKDKNQVTVKGPEGKKLKIAVQDPDMQPMLAKLKKGDTVEVTYTEAVAFSIQPKK